MLTQKMAWRLAPTMTAIDARATLNMALEAAGLDADQRPRLLSDNGSAFIAEPLAIYLRGQSIEHVRGAPYHPQTQGKIERWHRSMKAVVKLENFYFPWELEQAIASFVDYYNHQRYHESLDNLTPADVFYGRGEEVLNRRQQIKQQTMDQRRQQNLSDLSQTG